MSGNYYKATDSVLLHDEGLSMKETNDSVPQSEPITPVELPPSALSFRDYPFTSQYLKSIPRDIRDLFIPRSPKELTQLEHNLIRFSNSQTSRAQVMEIQKKFKLPFRPNATFEETKILARITLLRMKNEKTASSSSPRDDEGDSAPLG